MSAFVAVQKVRAAIHFALFTALAWVAAADAAIFTVGANGTYATVQAGITAAIPAPGFSNEVRVQSGNYTELISLSLSAGTLTISGGWNSAFSVRGSDPNATTINGAANGRVLDISQSGGSLDFSNVLIVGGRASGNGGGLRALLTLDAFAHLHDLHFVLNAAQLSGAANYVYGGGVFAQLNGTSALQFDHNDLSSNAANADASAYGAGMAVIVAGSGNCLVQQNRFYGNVVTANAMNGAISNGGGLAMILNAAGQVSATDNLVQANRLDAPSISVLGAGLSVLASCATCNIQVHRNRIVGNLGGQQQVDLDLVDTLGQGVQAVFSNSLIEGGDARGLRAAANLDAGQLNLVNLTVADNIGRGIVATDKVSLSNSIAFGNSGGDVTLAPGVLTSNNLIGVDPRFVDSASGNYRLLGNSPGRDAGNPAPPGGFGLFDLDLTTRVFGLAVDIGAYEIGDRIFSAGFE